MTPAEPQILDNPAITDFTEAAHHLARMLKDAGHFMQAGTVTVKFKADTDKDGRFSLTRQITSKRPTAPNKSEEVKGDQETVWSCTPDQPGQQRIAGVDQ